MNDEESGTNDTSSNSPTPAHSSVNVSRENKESVLDGEGLPAARLLEILSRLKTAACDELRTLALPGSTMQDAILAVQRAVEIEERRHVQPAPQDDTRPIYVLRFNHDCLALGCTQGACDLCEANPKRRCTADFDKKYFKGDVIKAKCGGGIFIEMLEQGTGKLVTPDDVVANGMIELGILDGNKYEQLFPHGNLTLQNLQRLDQCTLIFGNEGRPVLQSDEKAHNRENGKVNFAIQLPRTSMGEMRVNCSSEALLSGRRPPFRLFAKFVSPSDSEKVVVIPGVSTNFIVASGRSRQSQKKSIPFADDPVSRLENMGKERIKKLSNLRNTAKEMNVDFSHCEHYRINTVANFKKLALDADTDGQLKQKILHMLKMSEKAWEEARDHAAQCITNDTRMRAWYQPGITDLKGLAYVCYMGETDICKPVALLNGNNIVLKEHLDPTERNLMKELQALAIEAWWLPNHPGWTFFNFDSEAFKQNHLSLTSLGQLRSDHHSRKWPIRKEPEQQGRKKLAISNMERETPERNVKRSKLNTPPQVPIPQSPPSPEPIRSPYEMGCFPTESPESRGRPADMFQLKDTKQPQVPSSYPGPVIPRNPPESAFTRKQGGRHNKNPGTGDQGHQGRSGIPDPSFLERFYITTPTKTSSNMNGTGNVYDQHLKTPFEKPAMEELLKKQMIPEEFKPDRNRDVMHPDMFVQRPIVQNVLTVGVDPCEAGNSCDAANYYSRSQASNQLSCSIESLPGPTKAAIKDWQCIRQIEDRGGYSNQDFPQSFDGSSIAQIGGQVSSPVPQQTSDGAFVLSNDVSTTLPIEAVSQAHSAAPGVMTYGIVFLPFPNDQQSDPKQGN